jgi:hypothetical protein
VSLAQQQRDQCLSIILQLTGKEVLRDDGASELHRGRQVSVGVGSVKGGRLRGDRWHGGILSRRFGAVVDETDRARASHPVHGVRT